MEPRRLCEVYDEWMALQLKALNDDPEAKDMIQKVAEKLGPDSCDADRIALWLRLRSDDANPPAKRARHEGTQAAPEDNRDKLHVDYASDTKQADDHPAAGAQVQRASYPAFFESIGG